MKVTGRAVAALLTAVVAGQGCIGPRPCWLPGKSSSRACAQAAAARVASVAEPASPAARVAPVAGPTLSLSLWREGDAGISAWEFMYFVPLISPEPVECHASPANRQRARLIDIERVGAADGRFTLSCRFEIVGDGYIEHEIDHAEIVRRHSEQLRSGGRLSHVLGCIRMQGSGEAFLRAEGAFENGAPVVDSVAMSFRSDRGASPVRIALDTLSGPPDAWVAQPEALADVASLRFTRGGTPARMEVTLAALHSPAAAETPGERLKGLLKGAVANALIPPIAIEDAGNLALLDFAAALAAGAPTFTFPEAPNLRPPAAASANVRTASAAPAKG